MRRRGFTLPELLVVLAIVASLMAMLLPAMARTVFVAHCATCSSNLHQWSVALTAYAGDNSSVYPRFDGALGTGNTHDVTLTFIAAMEGYGISRTRTVCPFRDPQYTVIQGGKWLLGYGLWVPRSNNGTMYPPAAVAGPTRLSAAGTNAIMTDDVLEYPYFGWPNRDTFSRTWGTPHTFNGQLVNANIVTPDGAVQTHTAAQWEFQYQSGNARIWY